MGQRKSKQSPSSYDVAPTETVRDFKYENKSRKGSTPQATTVIEPQSTTPVEETTEKPFDPKLLPSWLNEELFVDLLKEHVAGFKRISNFKPHPALTAGENYATLMLRVNIDAELKDKTISNNSFMLKVAHDSEHMRQMLKIANYFIPENMMYLEILPEFQQMYKDVGLECTLAPKAYKFSKDIGADSVLLQDLRPLGFKNANRLECLDMVHTKFALRKLAQLHAASAARVATKGPFADILTKGLFADKPEADAVFEGMIGSFKTAFLNNIKTYANSEKYESLLVTYLNEMAREFKKSTIWNPNEFNVLNHGDCWSNNMLFKYNDKGDVDDMLFVDFQMSKYGSPAQDLYYFIFSSVQLDIKLKKFDYLIRYYYDNLIEHLKLLKYPNKLPILRELHMQLLKYGTWTLSTSVITLPIVLLDPTELASMDNFIANDADGMAFKNALFSNKRYQAQINEILPWLYNRGLLDLYDYSNETPCAKSNTATPQPTFEAPKWVTSEIFQDILKKNFEGFKSIKDFKVSAGTAGGDNYASLMLQIDIEIELENGSSKSTSYMLKVAPSGEQAKTLLSTLNTFNKESAMYNEILPEFEKILGNVGVSVDFGPNSFDLVNKPEEDVLLLENMRPSGYKNEKRLEGLDEDHVKAVLKKIAQFHAASAYYALNKDFPSYMNHGMFTEDQREIFIKMTDVFLPMFYECVKGYEGHEEYEDKLMKGSATYFDDMSKATQNTGNKFNVLNHGDCWTNNILFKHDGNGKIENVFLIDYQLVQYGSPAYDLYYFLMSSPKLELKTEKFDYFIKYYHDHLVENLKLLKYPNYVPSLKELHEELLRKGVFGYSTVVGVMGAILLDPTEKANMDNMMSEEEIGYELRKQIYSNARYTRHAETLFTWLNRRGCLDNE